LAPAKKTRLNNSLFCQYNRTAKSNLRKKEKSMKMFIIVIILTTNLFVLAEETLFNSKATPRNEEPLLSIPTDRVFFKNGVPKLEETNTNTVKKDIPETKSIHLNSYAAQIGVFQSHFGALNTNQTLSGLSFGLRIPFFTRLSLVPQYLQIQGDSDNQKNMFGARVDARYFYQIGDWFGLKGGASLFYFNQDSQCKLINQSCSSSGDKVVDNYKSNIYGTDLFFGPYIDKGLILAELDGRIGQSNHKNNEKIDNKRVFSLTLNVGLKI